SRFHFCDNLRHPRFIWLQVLETQISQIVAENGLTEVDCSDTARRIVDSEYRSKSAQRSQVSHAGSGLRQAEQFGDLGVTEMLAMPHQQDFAIGLVELFEGVEESVLDLFADRGGGRRKFLVGDLSE